MTLVERARAGDRDAASSLWREHRAWIAASLIARGARAADLEDLLQETALAFVRHLPTLRDAASLRPWLRALAANALRTEHRKSAVRARRRSDEDVRTIAAGETPDAREDAQCALARLRALPPEYAEPLLLRCVRGLSQREIAATLGLPETTVETRLVRARRLLREQLAAASEILQ